MRGMRIKKPALLRAGSGIDRIKQPLKTIILNDVFCYRCECKIGELFFFIQYNYVVLPFCSMRFLLKNIPDYGIFPLSDKTHNNEHDK